MIRLTRATLKADLDVELRVVKVSRWSVELDVGGQRVKLRPGDVATFTASADWTGNAS